MQTNITQEEFLLSLSTYMAHKHTSEELYEMSTQCLQELEDSNNISKNIDKTIIQQLKDAISVYNNTKKSNPLYNTLTYLQICLMYEMIVENYHSYTELISDIWDTIDTLDTIFANDKYTIIMRKALIDRITQHNSDISELIQCFALANVYINNNLLSVTHPQHEEARFLF